MGPMQATNTGALAPEVYRIPVVAWSSAPFVTNTVPIVSYRGAGRPEAAALTERAVDLFAAELGLDPVDVRRRNLIAPDAFPYHSPTGVDYDSGDYEAHARRCARDGRLPRSFATSRPGAALPATRVCWASVSPCSWIARLAPAAASTARSSCSMTVGARAHRFDPVRPGTPHLLGDARAGPYRHLRWIASTVVHGDTDLVPRGGITGGRGRRRWPARPSPRRPTRWWSPACGRGDRCWKRASTTSRWTSVVACSSVATPGERSVPRGRCAQPDRSWAEVASASRPTHCAARPTSEPRRDHARTARTSAVVEVDADTGAVAIAPHGDSRRRGRSS